MTTIWIAADESIEEPLIDRFEGTVIIWVNEARILNVFGDELMAEAKQCG